MLDVGGRIVELPLALAQVRAQRGNLALWPEAAAQQAVLMQPLQPRGVADVGLAPRDVPDVPRIHQHHLEPALLEDLVDRDPVDPGRLHDDRPDAAVREPVGPPMQILGECLERAHRLRIPPWADRGHVHRRADVDRRGVRMNG